MGMNPTLRLFLTIELKPGWLWVSTVGPFVYWMEAGRARKEEEERKKEGEALFRNVQLRHA